MDAKVYVPNLGAHVNHTPIFEWHVVKYGFENKHHKDICCEEIEPCAQNMIIIMGPMVNIMEETYTTSQ
jgi:hypothetical protein